MTDGNMLAETVGMAAGALNILSTFPHLWAAWNNAHRGGSRDVAHIFSRVIQLLANLFWLGYGIYFGLVSLSVTTGIMSLCLLAVVIHLGRRP